MVMRKKDLVQTSFVGWNQALRLFASISPFGLQVVKFIFQFTMPNHIPQMILKLTTCKGEFKGTIQIFCNFSNRQ